MLQYDLKNRNKLPKHFDLSEVRTRHHNMITQHTVRAGSQCSDIMLHNSVCVLQDCSVLLFFFLVVPVTARGGKHMEVVFQRRRGKKTVTNHRKPVGKTQVQREIEVMELQGLHIIT